jgi:hypothetical protein
VHSSATICWLIGDLGDFTLCPDCIRRSTHNEKPERREHTHLYFDSTLEPEVEKPRDPSPTLAKTVAAVELNSTTVASIEEASQPRSADGKYGNWHIELLERHVVALAGAGLSVFPSTGPGSERSSRILYDTVCGRAEITNNHDPPSRTEASQSIVFVSVLERLKTCRRELDGRAEGKVKSGCGINTED